MIPLRKLHVGSDLGSIYQRPPSYVLDYTESRLAQVQANSEPDEAIFAQRSREASQFFEVRCHDLGNKARRRADV